MKPTKCLEILTLYRIILMIVLVIKILALIFTTKVMRIQVNSDPAVDPQHCSLLTIILISITHYEGE